MTSARMTWSGVLLAVAVGCAPSAEPIPALSEPAGPVSRQISTCGFELRFDRGSSELSGSARRTIREATEA